MFKKISKILFNILFLISFADIRCNDLIAVGTVNGVKILKTDNTLLKTYLEDKVVKYVAFSPDGTILAVSYLWKIKDNNWGHEVALLDIQTGEFIKKWKYDCKATSLAFNPDGTILAIGLASGHINFYKKKKKTYKKIKTIKFFKRKDSGECKNINSLDFSPDGKILAFTTGFYKKVILWDIQKRNNLCTINQNFTVNLNAISFSPDGKILALGRDGCIRLWDVQKKEFFEHPYSLPEGQAHITSIDFNQKGDKLAFGSMDGSVHVCKREKKIKDKNPFLSKICIKNKSIEKEGDWEHIDVKFSPNGKILAVGSFAQNNVSFWDTNTEDKPKFTEIFKNKKGWVYSIAFKPKKIDFKKTQEKQIQF